MKDKKYIVNILSKISQNEIKQIRKIYKNKRALDDYVFNFSKKIFFKMAFPYFRFEILLKSISDIINNRNSYSEIKEKDMKKILEKICFHFNVALDEYYQMLSLLQKPSINK